VSGYRINKSPLPEELAQSLSMQGFEGESKIIWVKGVDKEGRDRYIGKCATNEATSQGDAPEPRKTNSLKA
jgi:hypothetical protein